MIEAFHAVLFDTPAFHVLFSNSALITMGVLVGQTLVAPPAAWALARCSFPGRKALIALYLLLLVLPFQAVLLPTYFVLHSLGILNTLWAVILPGAFSTFPVLIMLATFSTISASVVESARLDGASEWDVFFRIGLPLGAPGIFAALLLGFFEYWNVLEQPLAYLTNQALWPIALFSPSTANSAAIMGAVAILSAIPGLLLFGWGHRYLEKGLGDHSTTQEDR